MEGFRFRLTKLPNGKTFPCTIRQILGIGTIIAFSASEFVLKNCKGSKGLQPASPQLSKLNLWNRALIKQPTEK